MPSKRATFTPLSILVRPHQNTPRENYTLVEAPSTALGSIRLIPLSIYYHIWKSSPSSIDVKKNLGKGGKENSDFPWFIRSIIFEPGRLCSQNTIFMF